MIQTVWSPAVICKIGGIRPVITFASCLPVSIQILSSMKIHFRHKNFNLPFFKIPNRASNRIHFPFEPLPFGGWSQRICLDRWLIGYFSADVEYDFNHIIAFLHKDLAL